MWRCSRGRTRLSRSSASSRSPADDASSGTRRSSSSPGRELEELDEIARRVLDERLVAAHAGHDLAAEARASRTQPPHLRLEVLHGQRDAVPAARLPPPAADDLPAAALAAR